MPPIDVSLFTNWLVTGILGLLFGLISTWVTYRLERKRDEQAWNRELEKLREQSRHDLEKVAIQFAHDREMLDIQFQHKMREISEELLQNQNKRIRDNLLQGVDKPAEALQELLSFREKLDRLASEKLSYEFDREEAVFEHKWKDVHLPITNFWSKAIKAVFLLTLISSLVLNFILWVYK